MPKVKSGKRQRAYRPKTKSGCRTCKIRRVKCDETRPACLRCTSTNRVCDGYNNDDVQFQRSSLTNTPTVDINASPLSKRSFAFFVQRTCPQLAGFFGSDFWERLVLQAAYHEPAVRHAIVAVGSIHELFEHQTAIIPRSDSKAAFALEQYNLAIRHLLVPPSQSGQHGVDVCLILCILFTCFENMQECAPVISHIRSGAKLLCETLIGQRNGVLQHPVLGSKSHMDSYAPLDVLAKIFARLDSQVRMMIGGDKFKMYERWFSRTTDYGNILSFSSIEEARDIFEYGIYAFTCSHAFTHSHVFSGGHTTHLSSDAVHFPAAKEANVSHAENLISEFSLALQAFIESKNPYFTPKETIAAAVLQLHVLNTYVSLHIELLPPNLSRRDEYMPQFEEMVVLGEKILFATSPGDDHGRQTTSFCLDMGVVIPLYTVASQCRDPIIRQKAIALLRSTSCQEGLWNSLLAARAAERIMEIEERGLAVAGSRPIFELDSRGGRLHYFKQVHGFNELVNVIEGVFVRKAYNSLQ